MLVGLADAWALLDESDAYRCAVLTGAGGSFCSGMDLKGPSENPYADRWKDDPNLHWRGLLRERQPSKPIVAAVEGYAVAGGTEILQGTQLRVAAEGATFGVFEVRRGLFPVGGSTVRLQRQIGYTHAMEMLLSGRPYTAQEAPGGRPRRTGGARRRGAADCDRAGPVRCRQRPARCRGGAALDSRDRRARRVCSLGPGVRDWLAGLLHGGRQGRSAGVRREARAGLEESLRR